MDILTGSFVLLIAVFLVLLFTREKNSKIEYAKKVGLFTLIGLCCAMIAFPFYGPIFGSTSILLNSIVLATLTEFK